MSDAYVTDLIMEELRNSCPGPTACHGCVSWCPACGPTSHVCDDPECDTHRRETDVHRDMQEAKALIVRTAEACLRYEEELLSWEGKPEDNLSRRALSRAISDHNDANREFGKLEEELAGMRVSWARLVPRRPGDTKRR